jgi:hypothetical protein
MLPWFFGGLNFDHGKSYASLAGNYFLIEGDLGNLITLEVILAPGLKFLQLQNWEYHRSSINCLKLEVSEFILVKKRASTIVWHALAFIVRICLADYCFCCLLTEYLLFRTAKYLGVISWLIVSRDCIFRGWKVLLSSLKSSIIYHPDWPRKCRMVNFKPNTGMWLTPQQLGETRHRPVILHEPSGLCSAAKSRAKTLALDQVGHRHLWARTFKDLPLHTWTKMCRWNLKNIVLITLHFLEITNRSDLFPLPLD